MLHRFIVSILIEPEIPIVSESELDVNLLRAAHQARLNKQKGMKDSLVFFVFCQSRKQDVITAIKQYAFPDIQIIFNKISDSDLELDAYDFNNLIGTEVSTWVDKNHPATLAYLCNDEYKSLYIWWAGIEATDKDTWDEALISKYAHALPDSHKKKARTWLAILSEILEVEEPSWQYENQCLLYAATLCEWLHGFEATSGNSFNDFDITEIYDALGISEVYLGFLLGQSAPNKEFFTLMDANDIESDKELIAYSLKEAISNKRLALRDMLSNFFGHDGNLFWTLYSAIWPKYNEPSEDLCLDLANPSSYGDISEVYDAWLFVTNGWTDNADDW